MLLPTHRLGWRKTVLEWSFSSTETMHWQCRVLKPTLPNLQVSDLKPSAPTTTPPFFHDAWSTGTLYKSSLTQLPGVLPRNISSVLLENPIITNEPMRKIVPSCVAPKLDIPSREHKAIPTTAPTAFDSSNVPEKYPIRDSSQHSGAFLP